jgi:curli biogenesis system outer membrane secretion channel CsgG
MLAQLLIAGLLLQATTNPQDAKPSASPAAPFGVKDSDTDPTALLKVRRIYVESFGDDVISRELQSMIVSSLAETKRFKVTENRERADAILKGVALEKSAQELHAYSEGTAAGRGAISDSSAHTETVSDAKLSVRLVNPDGDVIWTSTQESKGAKYKGSSADVADKCVKQLLRDVEKLEGTSTPVPASAGVHN